MTTVNSERYGFTVQSEHPYDEAVARVKASLKEQGFGVLSEVIAKTLKEKLNVDRDAYVILGACNPQFVNEALAN